MEHFIVVKKQSSAWKKQQQINQQLHHWKEMIKWSIITSCSGSFTFLPLKCSLSSKKISLTSFSTNNLTVCTKSYISGLQKSQSPTPPADSHTTTPTWDHFACRPKFFPGTPGGVSDSQSCGSCDHQLHWRPGQRATVGTRNTRFCALLSSRRVFVSLCHCFSFIICEGHVWNSCWWQPKVPIEKMCNNQSRRRRTIQKQPQAAIAAASGNPLVSIPLRPPLGGRWGKGGGGERGGGEGRGKGEGEREGGVWRWQGWIRVGQWGGEVVGREIMRSGERRGGTGGGSQGRGAHIDFPHIFTKHSPRYAMSCVSVAASAAIEASGGAAAARRPNN